VLGLPAIPAPVIMSQRAGKASFLSMFRYDDRACAVIMRHSDITLSDFTLVRRNEHRTCEDILHTLGYTVHKSKHIALRFVFVQL
jgi:hypothetical protein